MRDGAFADQRRDGADRLALRVRERGQRDQQRNDDGGVSHERCSTAYAVPDR